MQTTRWKITQVRVTLHGDHEYQQSGYIRVDVDTGADPPPDMDDIFPRGAKDMKND
jgi:hypothetical protein